MQSELEQEIDRQRRRIRIARTVDGAVRWTFYATTVVCVCLAALKISSRSAPVFSVLLVPAVVAASAAAMQMVRRFSRRDCAILLDRTLGLEERLATSLEASGPLAEAVRRDAAQAFSSSDVARAGSRGPSLREAGGLAGGLLFLAALLAVRPSAPAAESLPPELASAVRAEAQRLRDSGSAELVAAATELEQASTPEAVAEAVERLRTIEASSGGAGTEVEAAAAASGTALSSALAKHGALPRDLASVPPALDRRLEINGDRIAGGRHGAGSGEAVPTGSEMASVEKTPVWKAAQTALANRAWDSDYQEVVTAYFEVKR